MPDRAFLTVPHFVPSCLCAFVPSQVPSPHMAQRRSTRKNVPFVPTADMRVIVLHGDDPFLMREFVAKVGETLRERHGEIEQFTFDGNSADLASVLDELRSYGLMQQHKLVVLENADQFLTGQESRRRSLEAYVEAPVDDATLVMRCETWRPSKLDKLVKAHGLVHAVQPPDEATAIKWCIARCSKRFDTTIEPDAARALVGRIGNNLDRLNTELGKLAAFAGSGRSIGMADIVEMVGLSREEEAWAIQSAVLSGDPGAALKSLRELLTVSNRPETLVTWSVNDLLRKLHGAAQLLHQGVSPRDASSRLKLWGKEVNLILQLAERRPPEVFAQLLRASLESDWRTKRGYGNVRRNLEAITVRVTDSIRSS